MFITHLHSDHTVGLIDTLQTRWHFFGKTMDLVCSGDHETAAPNLRTMSCENFGKHIVDAAEQAGEIAQRSSESTKRSSLGPSSIVNYVEMATPLTKIPKIVWSSGDVKVRAIASRYIPGHLSYRFNCHSYSCCHLSSLCFKRQHNF